MPPIRYVIWDNITYLDARVTQSGSEKTMTKCVRIFLMIFDHEFVQHPREVSHFVTLKWARAALESNSCRCNVHASGCANLLRMCFCSPKIGFIFCTSIHSAVSERTEAQAQDARKSYSQPDRQAQGNGSE